MDVKHNPSYRQVRRSLLRLVGGPGHTHRLYGNPGYRRVLSAARNRTLDPALASVIAAEEHRCTPWAAACAAAVADEPAASTPDAA